MGRWTDTTALADQQFGLVTRQQLLGLGISGATASRLITERGWTKVHPGVYRLPGSPVTFAQSVMAAQLTLSVPSLATAATAAHLHGLRPQPDRIDLAIDEHARVEPPDGVRLLRSRTLLDEDVLPHAALRLATPIRTVIDSARGALPSELRALIIDARQRRLLSLDELASRLSTIGPVSGRGVLRRLVWELDETRCDSVLEAKVRTLLRDARLPDPAPAPVAVRTGGRVLHVDIGWPTCRLGIEVDGRAYHSTREQLERDHRRLNALTLAGWTVLRVGWHRVERDGERFAAEVRTLLLRAGRRVDAHM